VAWWMEFVKKWNGDAFLQLIYSLPMMELTTDASGHVERLSIVEKELIPIALACRHGDHAGVVVMCSTGATTKMWS